MGICSANLIHLSTLTSSGTRSPPCCPCLQAAGPLGDLSWLESARGGSRDWTREGSDSTVASMYRQASQAMSDREDDFAALKRAALAGKGVKHSKSMLVLPAEVRCCCGGGLWGTSSISQPTAGQGLQP